MATHRKKPMVEPARRSKRRDGQRFATSRGAGASISAALPGWGALSQVSQQRSSKSAVQGTGTLTTARFALWLFAVAIAATLYVGHVHATQYTFESLHALRKENLRLHLEHDRIRGELDHALGPTVIYPSANKLGLKEGFEYGPTLTLTH